MLKTKSKTVTTLDKKEKIAALFEKHKPLFRKLKIKEPNYIPKMGYFDSSVRARVIALFESEISKGVDIFTEFVNKDYDSEDESRTLYMWKYNAHYKEEYKTTDPHPTTGHVRYLIPVDELIIAKELVVKDDFASEEINIPNPDTDLPMDQMTIRDFAAIHLNKPVSFKPWLNEIIKSK